MKSITPQDVQAAVQRRTDLANEITSLGRTVEANTETRDRLACDGDLSQEKTLADMARANTLATLLPLRITAREAALNAADAALIETVSGFISGTCNPRARKLEAQALEVARKAMRPHISDPAALERAVYSSEHATAARFSTPSITSNPANGALRYAEVALAAWSKLDEIEAKLA